MRFKSFPFTFSQPAKIKNLIIMGDSLSDRGTLNKELLFGCIPMSYLSGLSDYSPKGRFTNGLLWSDRVVTEMANKFTIKRLKKKWGLDNTDISDAIINGDYRVMKMIKEGYSLGDDRFVYYNGKLWVRSYCVGGLTAHDYSWNLSTSIIRFFTRLIVSKLAHIRDELLNYDKKHNISYAQKSETLIIEWSGANDLITVNARPSLVEADKAVAARVNNVKKLIASGYRHFILFNLPNLALTPRYQALSKEEQDNAKKCTDYFNAQLLKACAQLNQEHPHCSIAPFDINTMFEHIYNHPQQYSFEKEKLKTPYNTSKDFDDPDDGISPSTGYMFYDDVHPTADMHALLAAYFYDQLEKRYEFLEPDKRQEALGCPLTEEVLLSAFRKHYEARITADRHSWFRGARSRIDYKTADLDTVFRHALKENGARTFDVLNKMGWINKEGQLILDEPVLRRAMAHCEVGVPRVMNYG